MRCGLLPNKDRDYRQLTEYELELDWALEVGSWLQLAWAMRRAESLVRGTDELFPENGPSNKYGAPF